MEHSDSWIKLARNEEEALKQIRYFRTQGYANDEIYVLAHDNEQTEGLVKLTQSSEIGINEEGVMTALANLFRSQGDKLRAKLESLGLSKEEAERYESELDKGRILIAAWSDRYTDGEGAGLQRTAERDAVIVPPAGLYMSGKDGNTL